MALDWEGWWWNNNKRTPINFAAEARLLLWRDRTRALIQAWVSPTGLLLQSLENNAKLSVEDVLWIVERVFWGFDVSTLSSEWQKLFNDLRGNLLSELSKLNKEPELMPIDAFITPINQNQTWKK